MCKSLIEAQEAFSLQALHTSYRGCYGVVNAIMFSCGYDMGAFLCGFQKQQPWPVELG